MSCRVLLGSGSVRVQMFGRESAFSNVEEFSYTIVTRGKTTHGGCSSTRAFLINNGDQSSLLMNYSSQSVGIQRAGKA